MYNSVNQMLDNVSPDAVFICIPPYAHGEAEVACIKYKIPFFVEKPIARNMATAKKIARSVRTSGITTSVGYMNRYRQSVREAKKLLQRYPANLIHGGRFTRVSVDHPWLTQKALSGGQLLEQTTHFFDLVRYLCGEVSSVFCYGSRGFIPTSDTYDIEDSVSTILQMKSGAVASISGSWSSGFGDDSHLVLLGPDIKVEFKNWDHDVRVFSHSSPSPIEIAGEKDIFAIEDRAFLDAVRSGDKTKILSDYDDAVRTLKVGLAAIKSLEAGRPVKLTTND